MNIQTEYPIQFITQQILLQHPSPTPETITADEIEGGWNISAPSSKKEDVLNVLADTARAILHQESFQSVFKAMGFTSSFTKKIWGVFKNTETVHLDSIHTKLEVFMDESLQDDTPLEWDSFLAFSLLEERRAFIRNASLIADEALFGLVEKTLSRSIGVIPIAELEGKIGSLSVREVDASTVELWHEGGVFLTQEELNKFTESDTPSELFLPDTPFEWWSNTIIGLVITIYLLQPPALVIKKGYLSEHVQKHVQSFGLSTNIVEV